jgi:fermentation-respiration switch protein FrsA (DUF1100 family)
MTLAGVLIRFCKIAGVTVFVAGGVIYGGVLALLYAKQDALLFPADRSGLDVAAAEVPGLESVTFPTPDGLELTAWFRAPAPGKPTLVYFHGNGGNLMLRIGRVRFFAATGWGLLFMEYRGYGGNPGRPSETGLHEDASGAMLFLASQNVADNRVILYGESLGTGIAVWLATQKHVAAVILDSPYTSIADVAQSHFWFLPVQLLIKNRFDLLARIGGINAPLFVMQGALDNVVPPAMGQKVYAAAREPKAFWSGTETQHWNVLETGGGDAAMAFVARYVPGA